MKTITSIGLIIAGAVALLLAARRAASETERPSDQPRVVRPTSMNAGTGLQLASHGIGELTTDDGAAIPVLHVRAVIVNTTPDLQWALDASNARVELPSGPIAAAFVSSDAATLPIAILGPGERRTIDFFFPLTPDLANQGGPPGFALTWAVYTPARTVRTAWFDCGAPVAPSEPQRAGWGEHWWFDSTYAWPTYRHREGPVTHRPPRYVVVTKAPRWEEILVDEDDREPRLPECNQW